MPEPGGLVDRWPLRSKVVVVFVVPAVVALVLGAARVRAHLDDASRLDVVRDQLVVVRTAAGLAALLGRELTAPPDQTAFRQRAVDSEIAVLQRAAHRTPLLPGAARALGDAVGRLEALRQQTVNDPVLRAVGYAEVVDELSAVPPAVLALAEDRELDATATELRSLMRAIGASAVQDSLLHGAPDGRLDQRSAAAARRAAVLAELLDRNAPEPDAIVPDTDLRGLLPPLRNRAAVLGRTVDERADTLVTTIEDRADAARDDALRASAAVLGALLVAFTLALLVARSLLSPLRRLRTAALTAAHQQLPEVVARVRAGEEVDWRTIQPVPVRTDEEVGHLARAFDDMRQQAVRLAVEQTELRRQVSEMFMTLSRRNQSLVELQFQVIEGLEADEPDPRRLEELFRLDHLATRLRRNSDNLLVLAGGTPSRRGHGALDAVELLRAAISEVADYRRITVGRAAACAIRATAAPDVVHILAELLENACRFSPPDHPVVLTADHAVDGGMLVEVVDTGLGMAPDDLARANARLAGADAVGPETTRRMGLYVVSRLAGRHGVSVRLRPTTDRAAASGATAGTTASVHVPGGLVVPEHGRLPTPRSVPAPLTEQPTAPVARVPASHWFSPTADGRDTPDDDETWRAMSNAVTEEQPAITPAGLPLRGPARTAVPSGAVPPDAGPDPAAETPRRDPDAVRSTLSRHYDGMRAARARTAAPDGDPAGGP